MKPSPEVTVETVWCMTVHCDHSEKHEGSSEHRDGLSCGSRTSRWIKIRKNHQEYRDGENLKKWSRRSRWVLKTVTEVSGHERIRAEQVDGSKKEEHG